MQRSRHIRVIARVCAAAAALTLAPPAHAEGIDLLSAETILIVGDARVVASNGEQSWLKGGFGKLRSSSDRDGDWRVRPELGNVDLVWQPRFAWSLTGLVTTTLQ